MVRSSISAQGLRLEKLIENVKLNDTSSDILSMWASHFSALGQPTIDPCLNEEFRQHIELNVKQTPDDCLYTLTCSEGLFTYDIVIEACLGLKNGVAGGLIQGVYKPTAEGNFTA